MKLFLSVQSAGSGFDNSLSATFAHESGTIGRSSTNLLVLPDPNRWISSKHAEIKYLSPDYYMTDTSTNGILFRALNQQPKQLGSGNSVKLNDGDQFQIGDYVIVAKLLEDSPQFETRERAKETVNFSGDLFSDFNPVSIQEIIKENDLFSDNQPSASEDPLDFSFLEPDKSNSRGANKVDLVDLGHIPPNKEIYQPKQRVDIDPFTTHSSVSNLKSDSSSSSSSGLNKAELIDFEDIAPNKETFPPPHQKEIDPYTTHSPISNSPDLFADDWLIPSDNGNHRLDELPSLVEPELPTLKAVPHSQSSKKSLELGSQDEIINQFLMGIGLEKSRLAETLNPHSFYIIGKILKESIHGTREILIGRGTIKNEMHLDVTQIRSRDNNPIKFSASTEEALEKLLANQEKGYLEPQAAIKEAYDDIRAHQYAVIAGMRTALMAVLKRFDPKRLEQRLQVDNPIGANIPVHRQAKLWSLFEHLYQHIENEARDNFYHLFGQAFAETYEQQMQKLKKSSRDSSLD